MVSFSSVIKSTVEDIGGILSLGALSRCAKYPDVSPLKPQPGMGDQSYPFPLRNLHLFPFVIRDVIICPPGLITSEHGARVRFIMLAMTEIIPTL